MRLFSPGRRPAPWKPWSLLPVMLIVVSALTACSDDDEKLTGPSAGESLVRVGHLSPDAGPVDIWVDSKVVLQDVPFEAFSDYLTLSAETHLIQVTPANRTMPIAIEASVTLAADTRYTVTATGWLADGSLDATVSIDDPTPDPANARVRFIHAAKDAPAVDITLTDGTVLFGDVEFRDVEDYIAVPQGFYDLQVRLAGTETVVISFGNVPVSNGTLYSVFATGVLADGSLGAIVTVDGPGNGSTVVELDHATSELRVGHLSPDAPNVDIYFDDAPVDGLQNVPFPVVSGYLQIPAATANLKAYAAGESTNPVIDADVTFLPNRAYSVIATGLVDSGDLAPLVLEDDRIAASNGEARVRFVHASPDAPAVDIVVVPAEATLFDGREFREIAGYSPVGAGSYDLEVRLDSNGAVALAIDGLSLMAGTNYTVFAIGLAGDASLTALPVIDTP